MLQSNSSAVDNLFCFVFILSTTVTKSVVNLLLLFSGIELFNENVLQLFIQLRH